MSSGTGKGEMESCCSVDSFVWDDILEMEHMVIATQNKE
jgi:hypothetical protein